MAGKAKHSAKHGRHKNKAHEQTHHWHMVFIVVGFAGIVLLIAAILGAGWFYGNRALPGVQVGRVEVGQADAGAIRQAAAQQQDLLIATITLDGKTTTVPLSELGVTVDLDATVRQALQARRHGDILQNAQLWAPRTVPLVLNNDWGKLKEYIGQHYPALFVDPINAHLEYDGTVKQFRIVPGTQGKGFDIKAFEQSLPQVAAQPGPLVLQPTPAAVDPLISPQGLKPVQEAVNARLHLPLRFMHNDGMVLQLDANEIASWVHFTPDATRDTAAMEFDRAKIEQYITDKVAPKIATPPVDRKVVVDEQTGQQTILVAGVAGQRVARAPEVAQAVQTALINNQPLDQALHVEDAPFKTVTLKGADKWIEVDISKQTLTLYVDTTPVQSFLISSGTAKTPTEHGTFRIYSKLTSQTMTGTIAGEYYYLTGVKWVNYFNGGTAIHGTYWHNNFGRPMSHGCINMTEADAKTLYDFAPIGTKVVVHA